ncbi:MAG: hypothetical protein AB1941_28690 [Gemmatimonadota bacterium]
MRRRPLAPAALLLLALAACMPSDEGAPEAAPGSTTPAPDPQEAPQPAPDAPTSDTRAWTVGPRGAGPVQVGMPLAAAATALGATPDTAAARGGCSYLRPAGGPGGVMVMVNEGQVARVDVDGATARTAEGAGVGDAEARVRELYAGRVTESPHKYTDGRYLTVTPQTPADSAVRLVFETDGAKVTRFRAGRLPEVEWVEGCS